MTLLFIIMASLIAAGAFVAAGFLLSPRQPSPPPDGDAGDADPTEDVRELVAVKALEKELDELRAAHATVVHERDQARAEQARLRSGEKQAAERLRIAEDANRAAFEREENAAEGWAAQLAAAQADQKRHERELERQLTEVQAKLAAAQAEHERLLAEAARRGAEAATDRAALDQLREQTARDEARRSDELAAERARLERALLEGTAAGQATLAAAQAREQRLAATVSELERALEQQRGQRAELADQLARQQAEGKAVEYAREEMELRMRAAEEVVELLRGQVAGLNEAVRVAELRAKDRERLGEENAELRDRLADVERDAVAHADRANATEDATRDAKVQLAAAQAKLAELDRVKDENRRLRDEVAELRTHEQASDELERERAAHKQVRLDAELMARRLQELMHARTELESLRERAADAEALAGEVEYLREREKDLEAQIYASGSYSSREMRALTGELPVITPISDLETNLALLVGHGSARTAVLADGQGFLIASAGESVAEEGLAAFAAVASEMVGRARMLLPLADIRSIRVVDANRVVLTCHLFDSAGEAMGVATLGPAEAPPENTARAIAGVSAVVAPRDDGHAETPEPEA